MKSRCTLGISINLTRSCQYRYIEKVYEMTSPPRPTSYTTGRVLSTDYERAVKSNLNAVLEIMLEQILEGLHGTSLRPATFAAVTRLPQQILLMATYRMSSIQEGQSQESIARTQEGVSRCVNNFDAAMASIRESNIALPKGVSRCMEALERMKVTVYDAADFSLFLQKPQEIADAFLNPGRVQQGHADRIRNEAATRTPGRDDR